MKKLRVPTLETILTDPRYFGLETATPVQRAKCRIIEGRPLAELAFDPDVVHMLGGKAALPRLARKAPAEVLDISASRVAKTLSGAALCVYASQRVDVSAASLGDLLRFHVAALKVDGTRPFMTHLVNHLEAKPALRSIVVGEPTVSGVSLRHPSGRVIEVVPVPIDRAGGSALSVYSAGVFVDEFPRMLGADDGVRNVDHFRDALGGRMLPRSVFFATGSPWAPFGPAYDAVLEFWGKPSADLVVLRTTGKAGNPFWWTPERRRDLERRNPTAYRTDCLAEFADRESALIASADLQAVTRAAPLVLPPEKDRFYFGAIDPGTRRNAFTFMLGTVEERGGERVTRVVLARQWLPRGGRLDPEDTFRQIAADCRPYGVRVLYTDQHSIDSNTALARRFGLQLHELTITAANKTPLYLELAAAIAGKRFECCPDPVVRADLLSIRRRVTQAGISIELPVTSDGRHADFAPAAALVHYAATEIGPDDDDLLARVRRQRDDAARDYSTFGGSGWGSGGGAY